MLEEVLMPVLNTRITPDLIERYTPSGHWGSTTFYTILQQRAAVHPDREAIIDHRQRVTYGELHTRVERTAAALQHLGIGPGDVVTIPSCRRQYGQSPRPEHSSRPPP